MRGKTRPKTSGELQKKRDPKKQRNTKGVNLKPENARQIAPNVETYKKDAVNKKERDHKLTLETEDSRIPEFLTTEFIKKVKEEVDLFPLEEKECI